jgi:hypothetical protein
MSKLVSLFISGVFMLVICSSFCSAYDISEYYGASVYVASSGKGKCWHAIAKCGNIGNVNILSLSSAISQGYSACQKCSHILFQSVPPTSQSQNNGYKPSQDPFEQWDFSVYTIQSMPEYKPVKIYDYDYLPTSKEKEERKEGDGAAAIAVLAVGGGVYAVYKYKKSND